MTHQSHDIISQVPSQIGGHKAGEACERNARVILVGAAEILEERRSERKGQRRRIQGRSESKEDITDLSDLIGCQHVIVISDWLSECNCDI